MSTSSETPAPPDPLFASQLSDTADRPFVWSPEARPLSAFRNWSAVGLVAAIVGSILFVIASAGLIFFEGQIDTTTGEVGMNQTAWDVGYAIVGLVSLVALPVYFLGVLLVAIFHSRFVFRATKNLTLSKTRGIDFSPSWAVWVHYIPIISFWMPIGKVGAIWAASLAPRKPATSWPAKVGWWWGLFVGSNILSNISFRLYNQALSNGDLQLALITYWMDIVSWSVTAVSCILLMQIHRDIDLAQQHLATEHASVPSA